MSTKKAKTDRKVPTAPKHLVPIIAEPNPIPVLLVWLLIGPLHWDRPPKPS